jgi:hypothetical protein
MSLFKAATSKAKPDVKAKPNAKKEFPLAGLEEFAELVAMQQALAGLIASKGEVLKNTGYAKFIELSRQADGAVPASWVGVDGVATCSMEARKRGTNSPLSVDEIAILKQANITPATEVIVGQLFGINPAYAGDAALLERVSDAISGFVPEDFIIVQNEKSKQVVSIENQAAAWKTGDANVIAVVTTMGIKPKLATVDFDKILDKVGDILAAAETDIEEA